MWPQRCTARSTMRAGASSAVKSTAMVATRSASPMSLARSASLSSSRPTPRTAMPISASLVAHPKPIPLLAPVTIATCMSIHLRQFRPDLMLEYLARVVAGQAFGNDDLFGRLELRDTVVGKKVAEALDIGAGGGLGHDDGTRPLTGSGVRKPHDCDLEDVGVSGEDVLDLLRRDVLAAADDDV